MVGIFMTCILVPYEANGAPNGIPRNGYPWPINHPGPSQPPIQQHPIKMEPKREDPHICQWLSCSNSYNTIESLVDHIHKDHLEKDGKRELVCLWDGCSRTRKPFKVPDFVIL